MDPSSNGNTNGGVQPDQGQGGDGGSDGLYQAVLEAVPDSHREAVQAALKEMEGNVTRRFQDAADYRKQWEPYGSAGIDQVPADELVALVNFHSLLSDPDLLAQELADPSARQAIEQWWEQIGSAAGFFDDEEPGNGEAAPDQQLVQSLMEQLDQRLGPIEQRLSAQDQEGRVRTANEEIDQALAELRESDGEFDEDAVLRLARSHDGTAAEVIQAGFRDYQQITGAAEQGLVNDKLGQPSTPEQGGSPATGPEPITSFEDAAKAARARLSGATT